MTIFDESKREAAPDFELTDHQGQRVKLSELRGQPVVLFFYPKAFTPVCTRQTACFQDNAPELAAAGALVFGISGDTVETQADFASSLGVSFPILSDADGTVAGAYGLTRKLLPMAKRVTFVVDAEGRIAARFHHELQYRKHVTGALEFLRTTS